MCYGKNHPALKIQFSKSLKPGVFWSSEARTLPAFWGAREMINTNTPSKPINQVALSFITTQFSFSGRNDSLITAEQI